MKIDEQTRRALASYTGTITSCRPGKARGHAVKPKPLADDAPKQIPLNAVLEERCIKNDGASQWLSEHKDIVPVIDEAERLRRKKGRARRRRLRRARNAELRKRQYQPRPSETVERMTVAQRDAMFVVMNGGSEIAGPFATHAAAWSWIDHNTDDGRAEIDRNNRIRIAFRER